MDPKRRSRAILAVALVTVTALVVGGASLLLRDGQAPYASFRLAREEEIPGSLGFILEPPPEAFRPSISPAEAMRIAAGAARQPPPGVDEVLASVPSALVGASGTDQIAVWVLIARKLCYFASKGDVVSSARSAPADQELPACTRKNLSAVLVDARTGMALAAIRGYDLTGNWKPAVASP